MAQLGKVRKQRPQKKGFRIPSSVVQWGIVGIVGGVMAFFLVRSLATKPFDTPPTPFLSNQQQDLTALTHTVGDIEVDSTLRAAFPADMQAKIVSADTMVAQRRLNDAINLLYGGLRSAKPATLAALRAYIGFCYYTAKSSDMALMHWRKGLAVADSANPALVPWLAFAAAYLFQTHGVPDSALAYYERVPAGSIVPVGLGAAAVLNNSGFAREALADTAGAIALYEQALAAIDTVANASPVSTIRENLIRLNKHR
jgi:tetratricopeptide (TPR) repeat protein